MKTEPNKIKITGIYNGSSEILNSKPSFTIVTDKYCNSILKESYEKMCKAIESVLNDESESENIKNKSKEINPADLKKIFTLMEYYNKRGLPIENAVKDFLYNKSKDGSVDNFIVGEKVGVQCHIKYDESNKEVWVEAMIKDCLYFKDTAIVNLFGDLDNNPIAVSFSRLRKTR